MLVLFEEERCCLYGDISSVMQLFHQFHLPAGWLLLFQLFLIVVLEQSSQRSCEMVSSHLPVLSSVVSTGWITVPYLCKTYKTSLLGGGIFFFFCSGDFGGFGYNSFECTIILCSDMSKKVCNYFHTCVTLFMNGNLVAVSKSWFVSCIVSHCGSLWLSECLWIAPKLPSLRH